MSQQRISISIETASRAGGVALGADGQLLEARSFDSNRRHATELLVHLSQLLEAHGFAPGQIDEVHVSLGPGSFTGTRVGVTVARTLAQATGRIDLVGVATAEVIAAGAEQADWDHLTVCLAGKAGTVHATCFARDEQGLARLRHQLGIVGPEQLLAEAPKGAAWVGEGLNYLPEGSIPPGLRLEAVFDQPRPEHLLRVGRAKAAGGDLTDPARLLPIYPRKAEAVRLWELRHGKQS
ncbi:MAG: tRNA (adenosine(37)-N6)-threonylcarbamoyltransferase complex dimerization subunit type 1 TsaB [Phycisphaerae bacterium]